MDALAYPDTDSAYGSESDSDDASAGRQAGRNNFGEEEEKEATGSLHCEFKPEQTIIRTETMPAPQNPFADAGGVLTRSQA